MIICACALVRKLFGNPGRKHPNRNQMRFNSQYQQIFYDFIVTVIIFIDLPEIGTLVLSVCKVSDTQYWQTVHATRLFC